MATLSHATRQQFGRELGALLTLAIPVVLSELGWVAMGVVDTIMVGKLGAAAIGAVGLSAAVYYVPSLLGIGLLLGLDTLVSQAFGRADFDECHRWLAQSIYLAALYTPLAMLFVWAAPGLYARLGINASVAGLAGNYLRLLNWGTLPLLVYAAFRRYLQGVGRVRPVTFALLSANLVNWFGNWALIYGHFGMPAMGVRGSALSTCVARVYMAAVLVYVAWRHEAARGHPLFRHWAGLDARRIRTMLGLGAPAAGQIVLEVGAFGAATLMAGRLSADALAAHQIVLNCASTTFMVPLGISAAAAVSVGQAYGAGDLARSRRAGWLSVALGSSFMALAGAAFLLWPDPLMHIYTYAHGVVSQGEKLLVLAAAFQVFDGVQTISTGALRGLGETRLPMYANLVGYWAFGLPLGYGLCFGLGHGIQGIWIGLTFALIAVAICVLLRWQRESGKLVAVAGLNV